MTPAAFSLGVDRYGSRPGSPWGVSQPETRRETRYLSLPSIPLDAQDGISHDELHQADVSTADLSDRWLRLTGTSKRDVSSYSTVSLATASVVSEAAVAATRITPSSGR